MLLPELLTGPRCPHLIGGGGKTTLMYALARVAVARGETVITTTTTHILPPTPAESPCLLVAPAAAEITEALRRHRQVTVVAAAESGKLSGTAENVNALAGLADRIIVEADGSAGRPLKAHAEHEPVISTVADAIIAVLGADAIFMPLADRVVHRHELFAQRFKLEPGTLLTLKHIAAAMLLPDGYAAHVPENLPFIVVITRVLTPLMYRQAEELSGLLLASPRVSGVVMGDLVCGELMERRR